MALVWSLILAAAFSGSGTRVAGWLGFAVFSHFLLDLPMHPPDLALWPNAEPHVGFGLWRSLPTGWWFVELVVIAIFWVYYWKRAEVEKSFGGRPLAVGAVLLFLHVFNSPWFSQLSGAR